MEFLKYLSENENAKKKTKTKMLFNEFSDWFAKG